MTTLELEVPNLNAELFDSMLKSGSFTPDDIEGIELHGFARFESCGEVIYEMEDEFPEYFCVHVHLKEGGVDGVGDFSDITKAQEYAQRHANKFGWRIDSYLRPVGADL